MQRLTPKTIPDVLREHLPGLAPTIVPDLPRSRDAFLADARDGRRFLDFAGGGAGQPLGYNHKSLADAAFAARAGRCVPHSGASLDLATQELVEFALVFTRVARPQGLPHVALAASDPEAFDGALAAAFAWKAARTLETPGTDAARPLLAIGLRQARHGRSGWALSLSGGGSVARAAGPRHDWPSITSPTARFPLEGAVLRDVEDREIQALAELRTHLRERQADVAAVVVEPLLVEAGDLHLRGEFLREVRKACDEFGTLLVFDEVRTGIAATGKTWCFEHFDVHPDLLVFGGVLGISGVLAGSRLDGLGEGAPGGVARSEGNPSEGSLTALVRPEGTLGPSLPQLVFATRVLEAIESDGLVKHAATVGTHLLSTLGRLAEADARITNVRGRGLLAAVDLPSGEHRDRVVAEAVTKGLLVGRAGARGVRLRPPLPTTKANVEHGVNLLHDALVASQQD